ncbi:MAG TPA: hypothetical protein PJ991_07310 [Kiritimatiellia bacterium]|nr:hypothetical protein [Kiritimatiellia bacterium]
MTPFIIPAVIGGAIIGIAIGFAIQPLKRRAARRRAQKKGAIARERIPEGRLVSTSENAFTPMRRWRIKKPHDHGYYSAGRD